MLVLTARIAGIVEHEVRWCLRSCSYAEHCLHEQAFHVRKLPLSVRSPCQSRSGQLLCRQQPNVHFSCAFLAQGTQGTQRSGDGVTGSNGYNGKDGRNGVTGPAGVQGARGRTGATAEGGDTGDQGERIGARSVLRSCPS